MRISFISPAARWYNLGVAAAREDVQDGYRPNGSVDVATLAQDAYSMLLEDDAISDSDAAWRKFYEGYADVMEEYS